MMKYNPDFWPLYIFSSDHLYLSYFKVQHVFYKVRRDVLKGRSSKSATEGKRSLMINEGGDYFF